LHLRFIPLADADVIGARQASAHQDAAARQPDVRVIRRAGGYGEVEITIVEDFGTLSIPMLDHVGDTLAADLGDEESAVEEDGVGDLTSGFEEGVQGLGDGGGGDGRPGGV